MRTLKQRVTAGVAGLALVTSLGISMFDTPSPASATSVVERPPPPVIPSYYLTDWPNWSCMAGIVSGGVGFISSVLFPPAGVVWNVLIWGTFGYGAYQSAQDCRDQAPPGLVCGPFKYAIGEQAKYYDYGCQYAGGRAPSASGPVYFVSVGGEGEGTW